MHFKILNAQILFLILILTVLSGCSKDTDFIEETLLMDTFVRIEIKDDLPREVTEEASVQAIMKMTIIAGQLDYFSQDGELALINKLKKDEPFSLSNNLLRVLRVSKDLYKKTQGAFDVTLGSGDWVLNEKRRTIVFKSDDTKIDLGGIAKGFVVDEGIKILKSYGIKNALINAGGDMYCMGEGRKRGGGWKIGIRDPMDPKKITMSFTARDKGIATSGGYERFLEVGGKKLSHIVDPKTKKPIEKIERSVTVVAMNCTAADGYATAIYVLGPGKGLSLIENIEGIECIMIDDDGKVYRSSGLSQIGLTKIQ